MADVKQYLDAHLRRTGSPFLFVGSGFSRRYTACPDWAGLLSEFASRTSHPYDYYRASAQGDLPTVASRIAEVFHDVWWSDSAYEDSRARWSSSVTGMSSALKIEIASHVLAQSDALPSKGSLADELTLFRSVVVDGVITTNFDNVLERLLPDLRVFVGQDQMLFSNPQGIGELYKIHGTCDAPDTLVLTAEDYERFEDRNSYLAAKLLAIFVEHPVIFLGYSLQDRNVLSVLRSIAACLTEENIHELRDRLIFVQWVPNEKPQIGSHSIMVDGFVINVLRVQVPDYTDLFSALASLPRIFPAQLLRRLKEHVYELVLSGDPQKRLYVADIDDAPNADIDVVFGVGIRQRVDHVGYVGLTRWNLIDDVIDNTGLYDGATVVTEALPRLLQAPGNVPVFKYLKEASHLTKAGTIRKGADIDPRIERMADAHRGGSPAGAQYQRAAETRLANIGSILELEQERGPKDVLNYGTCMKPSLVDPADLRSFLQRYRSLRSGNWEGTQYAKLACYLDWLENGRGEQ